MSTEVKPNSEGLIEYLDAEARGDSFWACCPVPTHGTNHDGDSQESLMIYVQRNGLSRLTCLGGCTFEVVRDALPHEFRSIVIEGKPDGESPTPITAKTSKSKKSKKRGTPTDYYEYTEVDGKPRYRVVRLADPKSFLQQTPDGKGGWKWGLGNVQTTLYHLPELIVGASTGKVIYVAEGEKDVDNLIAHDVIATCNSGGAGHFRSEFGSYFVGASEVVITADNDVPGMKHAAQVFDIMTDLGISVRVVKAVEGKDVSDHLAAGHSMAELVHVPEAEFRVSATLSAIGFDDADEGQLTPTQQMVNHLLSAYDLGCDREHAPWAVPKVGPRIAIAIEGRGALQRQLMQSHWDGHASLPSQGAAGDACALAHATAESRSVLIEPSIRAAVDNGNVVVDLGRHDGQVLTVRPGSWSIGSNSQVVWRRTRLTGEMPVPQQNGDINLLRNHIRVSDADWPAVVAWMIHTWMPDRPCPIILLRGPAGAAKSSTARRLLDLVDPAGGGRSALRSAPRDAQSWSVSASASRAIGIDNLTSIPQWWRGSLCTAVTGALDIDRALYTDSDLSIRWIKKSIILTGIDVGTLSSDLAERTIGIELETIPDDERVDESQLDAAWLRDQPAILGGLADVIATVLTMSTADIDPEMRPRMADFYATLLGVDQVLGTAGAESYLTSIGDLQGEIAEGDLVVQAIASMMSNKEMWSGTASELHEILTPNDPTNRWWPQSARALSGKINALVGPLHKIGIETHRVRGTGGVKTIVFTRTAIVPKAFVPTEVYVSVPSKPIIVPRREIPVTSGVCSDCENETDDLASIGYPTRLVCESCRQDNEDF